MDFRWSDCRIGRLKALSFTGGYRSGSSSRFRMTDHAEGNRLQRPGFVASASPQKGAETFNLKIDSKNVRNLL